MSRVDLPCHLYPAARSAETLLVALLFKLWVVLCCACETSATKLPRLFPPTGTLCNAPALLLFSSVPWLLSFLRQLFLSSSPPRYERSAVEVFVCFFLGTGADVPGFTVLPFALRLSQPLPPINSKSQNRHRTTQRTIFSQVSTPAPARLTPLSTCFPGTGASRVGFPPLDSNAYVNSHGSVFSSVRMSSRAQQRQGLH